MSTKQENKEVGLDALKLLNSAVMWHSNFNIILPVSCDCKK